MTARMPAKRRKRVIALLNAISDLHENDLHAVLKLERPLWEYEELLEQDDTSQPGEDGCVTHILGRPSALKSLRGRLRRGEALARLYEEHLFQLMVFGEAGLPSYQKLKKAKDEFGGRER